MPRIFTKAQGAEVRIGTYGTATNDQPALVPEAVAQELKSDESLRVEADEPPPQRLSATDLRKAQKAKDTES